MEFSLNSKVFEYMEAVHKNSFTHEVTTESIIPDSLPDAQRVIETDAMVYLRSKDAEDGRVTVSGVVDVSVIYADDEGCIKRTQLDLPFNGVDENGNIKPDSKITAKVCVASVDTRMLNPRKLLVRCDILIEVACYVQKEVQLKLPAVEKDHNVELLTQNTKLCVLTDVTEKTFVVREEYSLPPSKPLVGEILKSNVQLDLEEAKGVGNKIILKGAAKANMMYRPEKGGEPVSVEFSTVFSQIMELGVQSEGLEFKAFLMPTSVYFNTDSLFSADDRRIVLETHLLSQCIAYREEEISCIIDAYSSKFEISTEMAKIEFKSAGESAKTVQLVRGVIEAPRQVANIIGISALPGVVYKSREGDMLEMKTTVGVNVLYLSEDGVLLSVAKKVSASAELPAEADNDYICSANIQGEPLAVISTEGIEVKFNLVFNMECCRVITISGVSLVDIDTENPKDLSKLPSIVVKRFGEDDTLWSLAKKYSSVTELILKANGMEIGTDPELNSMLIIPRMR